MDKPVVIIGANGLGRVALDILNSNNITVYCFLDDDKAKTGKEIETVTIMGTPEDESLLGLIGDTADVFIASDETELKKDYTNKVLKDQKTMPMNAVHGRSYISSTAKIGHGNLINSGATLNAFVDMGDHNIIHSNVGIDYETVIGDFCQIGTGSNIASGVEIKDEVFIGTGVTIVPGIKIGKGARVGAGSVVVKDVKEGDTVFGNPANPI